MTKKCRICKQPYMPVRPMQSTCNQFSCMIAYADKAAEKSKQRRAIAEKREIAEKRIQIKTKSAWAREAQTVFNQFIRLRDEKLPCISCGRFHQGQYHSGHYRTVGSHPELRFEELNVHKQCSVCNNHKSGNIVEYRINLLGKIGAASLEWLEGHHEPKKYTVEDLKQIKATYKAKIKELK